MERLQREERSLEEGFQNVIDCFAIENESVACSMVDSRCPHLNLPRFRLHPYAAFPAASSGQLALSNSSGLRYPSAEWVLTLL